MTTVISRVYADEATADGVIAQLTEAGFPTGWVDKRPSGSAAEAIEATSVAPKTAAAYAAMLTDGATLVVVRAQVTPMGAAKAAIGMMDAASPLRADVETENRYIRKAPPSTNIFKQSVLEGSPLMLTVSPEMSRKRSRGLSEMLGLGTLVPSQPRASTWTRSTPLSQAFWPQPLLSSKPRKTSVISGGRRFLYNPS